MRATASAVFLGALLAAVPAWGDALAYWPQWRGPLATGEAPRADPPLAWSEGENVRWKVPIPGRGHATPIVWGDRVFVLSAEVMPEGGGAAAEQPEAGGPPVGPVRFLVLALDRATGAEAWRRVAREEVPHEGTHPTGTWASASAVTDGEILFAHFGSRGLYAYTLEGEPLWSKDLGDMQTRRGFGEGASPALWGEVLVVNWDHEGDSFVVALDRRSGRELWRAARDESTSWSTPLVVESGGRPQVVIAATGKTRSYDLASGELLWEVGGMTVNVIPSPVHANGVVYATSGFRSSALQAIRLADARGDLDGDPGDPIKSDALLWTYDRDTPYVPSPLLLDGALYFLKVNSGVLSSLDAATGVVRFGPERLPGIDNVYASPVAAAGRIYVVGRDGTTVVLRAGPTLEVLASNAIDEGVDASPALVGRELYLRGRRHLYCIAADPAPPGEVTGGLR